jgi:hypothetical protein
MKPISRTTFSTTSVAAASGSGRYADAHVAVQAGEGAGSVEESGVCVVGLVSRGRGTQTTSGAAFVVASVIEDMADEGGVAGGGQESGGAFACVA